MKVLAIQGSPRKKGNTDIVLDRILRAVRKKGHRSLGKLYAADMDVSGCIECFACQKCEGEPGCSIEDDMETVYKKMLSADLIVLATPVFCWGATAQLKSILDRLYATFKFDSDPYISLLEGKSVALVVTAGGSEKEGADVCEAMYKALFEFAHAKNKGVFIAPHLSTPAATKKDAKLLKKADAFGAKIA